MSEITFIVEEETAVKKGEQEFDTNVETNKLPSYKGDHNDFSDDKDEDYGDDDRELTVRLDKWLWAARFFKTRPLARKAVENCRVYYNGEATSPNTEIEVGSTITIFSDKFPRTDLVIRGLSTRRKNASNANELFTAIKVPINLRSEYQGNPRHSSGHPYSKNKQNNHYKEDSYKNSNSGDYDHAPRQQLRSPYGLNKTKTIQNTQESFTNSYDASPKNYHTGKKRNSTTRFLRSRKAYTKPEQSDRFGSDSNYSTYDE